MFRLQDLKEGFTKVFPFHPGGITKQGDPERIGHHGPPHLPRAVDVEETEREEGNAGG